MAGTNGSIVGLFVDFYGTVVAGDRACIEAICQKVIDRTRLGMTAGAFAALWAGHFFDMIETANGAAFRTLAQCERDSLAMTLAELRIDVAPDVFIDETRAYWRAAPAYPDAVAVLGALDLPVCIVSNADDEELLSSVAAAGLRFDHIVTSERARCYKPAGGIFELALAETGWPADRVLHVGDSRHSDVAGAQAVGLGTVWLCRPDRVNDRPDATPDHTVSDFHELGALLASLR